MKPQKPILSESGIKVENTISMALREQGTGRKRSYLVVLALLGTVSSIFTFLTMFTPACNVPLILLFSCIMLLFFIYHAEHPKSGHISLLIFLLVYVVLFFRFRGELTSGLMYLMNAVYQTIYMTDWDYFETAVYYPPEQSTTMLICTAVVPITWLLSYAVMRYQNFFLSLLVTFPFVEIGFFFGITPEHVPAIGLFSFWAGMIAVQLAGAGNYYHQRSRSGFQRRRNTFLPVAGMRFLLTENAGLTTAILTLAICMGAEWFLIAKNYERPDDIKEMRTDFQYYSAHIDWNDITTIFPFLKSNDGSVPEQVIQLGTNEKREFENKTVSSVAFLEKPESMIYLKFGTYDIYNNNNWSQLDDSAYGAPIFQYFDDLNYYPPEFLYDTSMSFGKNTNVMRIYNANKTLSQCVPYGFMKGENIQCYANNTIKTNVQNYVIPMKTQYETILSHCKLYPVSIDQLLNVSHDVSLYSLVGGREYEDADIPYEESESSNAPRSLFFNENYAMSVILNKYGYHDFVRENYLNVPDTDEMREIYSAYYEILNDFDAESADISATIHELQLLRKKLCDMVEYNLTSGKTPPDRDYAHYFLFENKKGYCTHYATAGVLLARMAGIPARYCEGYLVDNKTLTRSQDSAEYTTEILDSSAHAWAEVYIDNVGWIPFEFTYSYFTPPEELEETTEPTESVTMPVEIPSEVRETIPPETIQMTETTPVSPALSVPDTVVIPEHFKSALKILGCILFVFAVVMIFILMRKHALKKHARLLRQKDRSQASQYAWGWMVRLLKECGIDSSVPTTAVLTEEIQEHCSAYLSESDISEIVRIGTKLRYSPHGLTEEEIQTLVTVSSQLSEKMYSNASPFQKFTYKWIHHYS